MIPGFSWTSKPPTIGELRNPVSLVRASTIPDGGIGMDLSLAKVYDVWAKVENVSRSYREGFDVSAQKAVTHAVTIRHHLDLEAPEVRDFLVYNRRLLRVLALRELDPRGFYWIIACNDEGSIAHWVYDDPSTSENPHDLQNPQPEPRADEPFPFWK